MSTDMQLSKRDRQKARRAERLEAEAKQRQKQNAARRVRTIIFAVVGVALVVGLGYVLVQGTDRTLGVDPATIEGTALPSAVDAGGTTDPSVGATAPVVTGGTVDGETVTLGAPGTPQAIVFMAHWCPNCQEEAPEIAEWVGDGLLADGVELVAVSTLHDPARPNWPPDAWMERENFPGQLLIDPDDTIAEAYGLTGTPMWTFLDADGTVVSRMSGQISGEQFEAATALAAG